MKNLKYYINKALKEHFALGAFNFSNMENLQAIERACNKLKSPAIIAVSESALAYMGEDYLMALANCAKKSSPYLFLHLDHGKSFEICKKAIDLGFDSVMIDGSALDFEDNIALTKKVCDNAHSNGKLCEGELGQLKGIEDNVNSENHHYTNPQKAKLFVQKTNIDMLAVAIGTSHGAYKYSGAQTLRFDILEEIERALPNYPLVLHGASTVDPNIIALINQYGGKLKNANGIPKELLTQAIKNHNIVKINSDTDLRLSITSMVRKILTESPEQFDPRKYLGAGRDKTEEIVQDKILNLLFSAGKA